MQAITVVSVWLRPPQIHIATNPIIILQMGSIVSHYHFTDSTVNGSGIGPYSTVLGSFSRHTNQRTPEQTREAQACHETNPNEVPIPQIICTKQGTLQKTWPQCPFSLSYRLTDGVLLQGIYMRWQYFCSENAKGCFTLHSSCSEFFSTEVTLNPPCITFIDTHLFRCLRLIQKHLVHTIFYQ